MFLINVELYVLKNNEVDRQKNLHKIEVNIYIKYIEGYRKVNYYFFIYRGDTVNNKIHDEKKIIGVICR